MTVVHLFGGGSDVGEVTSWTSRCGNYRNGRKTDLSSSEAAEEDENITWFPDNVTCRDCLGHD